MGRTDPVSDARVHIVKDLEICLERWAEEMEAQRFLKEVGGLVHRLERWAKQLGELVREQEQRTGRGG